LGPGLVAQTASAVGGKGVVADALDLKATFGSAQFDGVISSECIEHTPSPTLALREMAAIVKSGGWLYVSTPNFVWSPVVKLATALRLRPFTGHENFSSFGSIRRTLLEGGIEVVRENGLHLWPFQFPLHRMSTWCDNRMQFSRALMINICMLGKKTEISFTRPEQFFESIRSE
jgi:2-polyprenyl-3-methyl-5-hydroxy-6-metoxy-1,4-benzoquinol methylase